MTPVVGLPASVRLLPADEPAALADLVGDAPVVAIGENNHGVREFGALRERLVRHLVRELGFGVVAVESGYAEGFLVDAWVRGGPGAVEDLARDGFTFRAGDAPEMQALVTGLREHREAGGRVRFAGLDIPGSGGSPEPALRLVRAHLAAHAPDAVPLVDAALEATRPYAAANNGAAPARYAALDAPARDAATAALARLLLRVEALGAGPEHRVARHLALGALRLDEQLREFAVLFAPDPPARVVSSRDVHMAETVRLLREETGERVVVLAHNGHVQRVPFAFMPGVSAPSAGTALAEAYGDDYVVVGLTALAGSTPGLRSTTPSATGSRCTPTRCRTRSPGASSRPSSTRGSARSRCCSTCARPGARRARRASATRRPTSRSTCSRATTPCTACRVRIARGAHHLTRRAMPGRRRRWRASVSSRSRT